MFRYNSQIIIVSAYGLGFTFCVSVNGFGLTFIINVNDFKILFIHKVSVIIYGSITNYVNVNAQGGVHSCKCKIMYL